MPSAGGGYAAVKYEAKAQRVPEKLALSIARIESNGACGAQSSANAIGVMQIKHTTAQMMGYTGSAKGLKNCKTSAKYGVKYLAMCLDLAEGDVKKAALCYNQGHGTLTNKKKVRQPRQPVGGERLHRQAEGPGLAAVGFATAQWRRRRRQAAASVQRHAAINLRRQLRAGRVQEPTFKASIPVAPDFDPTLICDLNKTLESIDPP